MQINSISPYYAYHKIGSVKTNFQGNQKELSTETLLNNILNLENVKYISEWRYLIYVQINY